MKLNIFVGLIFMTIVSQAQETIPVPEPIKTRREIYAYDYWVFKSSTEHLAAIDENPIILNMSQTYETDKQCLPIFKNAIKNGVLDIRYALGYFDDSQAIDVLYDGFNYGLSPSLDIGVYNVLRRVLTANCKSNSMQLCEFKESGDPITGKVVLSKKINIFGRKILAQMTLTHASASESFVDNKGKYADLQKKLTLQSEENFFDHIGKSDIVIYNGHSRNGGGPDFNPPRLNGELHVNYDGYYRVKRVGINRMLKQISTSTNKDSVLGLFSCSSEDHFYNDLIKANSQQRLVLSSETIDYFDTIHTSLGLLEGLLRGQCGQNNLSQFLKQNEKIERAFNAFKFK